MRKLTLEGVPADAVAPTSGVVAENVTNIDDDEVDRQVYHVNQIIRELSVDLILDRYSRPSAIISYNFQILGLGATDHDNPVIHLMNTNPYSMFSCNVERLDK